MADPHCDLHTVGGIVPRRFAHASRKRPKKSESPSSAGFAEVDLAQLTHEQLIAQYLKLQAKSARDQNALAKARNELKGVSKISAKKKAKANSSTTTSSSTVEIRSNARKIPDLSRNELNNALQKIKLQKDLKDGKQTSSAESLQVLLWKLGCNYCLQPHQFLAVRAIAAGKDYHFPGQDLHLDSTALQIRETLNATPWRVSDRGVIIADVMGLGKTVEAVAGAILRNAIANAKNRPQKPTLICLPNASVLIQWIDTLIQAGVDPRAIRRFQTKKSAPLGGEIFVLCTIHNLQTELRYCFDSIEKIDGKIVHVHKSPLFVSTPDGLMDAMRKQYRAGKRAEKDVNESIRLLLVENGSKCSLTFRTAILDEAVSLVYDHPARTLAPTSSHSPVLSKHFLKNSATYWGMAAALIGIHTERMVPMSGTPINNGVQDMATLITFIEPRHDSARLNWWKRATKMGAATRVVQAIEGWSKTFLVRRGKDALASQLPAKTVTREHVSPARSEMTVYNKWEARVLTQLGRLYKNKDNEVVTKLMAYAANAMLALDHPVLPSGGRDITIFFAPSRCILNSVLKAQEKRNICVCCQRRAIRQRKRGKNEEATGENDDLRHQLKSCDEGIYQVKDRAKRGARYKSNYGERESEDETENEVNDDDEWVAEEEGNDDDKDDASDWVDEYEDEIEFEMEMADENGGEDEFKGKVDGYGEIIPIPPNLCQTARMELSHYACESCLDGLKSCPRCHELIGRLRKGITSAPHPAAQIIRGVPGLAEQIDADAVRAAQSRTYCPEIFGGFQASAKLQAVVSTFAKIPANEKALIASSYKGSLDLLEAMLSEIYAVGTVARFDGDITIDEREKVLERFRTVESCRILLMTVKAGGVGLNLAEANHVLFVDRYWNPMVLEQCEDRCYRIGQSKPVSVVYHDAVDTIDDVMAEINMTKASNAGIILADAPALVANPSFKDTAGLFGNSLRQFKAIRNNKGKPFEPFPSQYDQNMLHSYLVLPERPAESTCVKVLKHPPADMPLATVLESPEQGFERKSPSLDAVYSLFPFVQQFAKGTATLPSELANKDCSLLFSRAVQESGRVLHCKNRSKADQGTTTGTAIEISSSDDDEFSRAGQESGRVLHCKNRSKADQGTTTDTAIDISSSDDDED